MIKANCITDNPDVQILKNTSNERDMVNIELPRQIVNNLKVLAEHHYPILELITHDKVIEALKCFFEDPIAQKRIFDEMLFEYLTGLSQADDNFIEEDRVLFLYQVNDLLTGGLDFFDKHTKEGGENV